jgi:hypothetical protein
MMNRSYVRRYSSYVKPTIPLEAPCNDREKNHNGYQKGQKRQKAQKYRLVERKLASVNQGYGNESLCCVKAA